MKNKFAAYIYGLTIMIGGFFLLFLTFSSFDVIKTTLAVTLIIGAIFAFLTAFSLPKKQVQFAYHEMHALAMLVYSIYLLFFSHNIETFVFSTSFLFIFYTFSEFIFCSWLFNLGNKINYKIAISRVTLGFLIGAATVLLFNHYDKNDAAILPAFGVLFIIVGLGIVLYLPILKTRSNPQFPKVSNKLA